MKVRPTLALLWLTFGVEALAQSPKPLLITHVDLIDVSTGKTRHDMTVVISANRITEVKKSRIVAVPEGAQLVDAKGKFLMPGLWDMHVHIFNQVTRRPPNTWYFPLFVANGVTSIREMWTKPENMGQIRAWRKSRMEDSLLAPRIAAVGALVDGPGGAETTNLAALQMGPTTNVVSTSEEARKFVRAVKVAGLDFVKSYSRLSPETYFAIADEAKKQGIPFAGHVPFAVDAAEASSAGQRSMEHLNQILESSSSRSHELFQVPGRDWSSKYDELTLDTFDETKFKKLVAILAKNHSWQDPTLVRNRVWAFRGEKVILDDSRLRYTPADEVATWKKFWSSEQAETSIPHRLWQKQLEIVLPMHHAGVPLLAGTDVGADYIYPGFSLHDELALFVQAGLSTGDALKTATCNPARFLGMLDRVGTVEKGKLADLVLLDANPLEDIHNTQRIRAVVLNGRYLDRAALDKLLAQAEANAR